MHVHMQMCTHLHEYVYTCMHTFTYNNNNKIKMWEKKAAMLPAELTIYSYLCLFKGHNRHCISMTSAAYRRLETRGEKESITRIHSLSDFVLWNTHLSSLHRCNFTWKKHVLSHLFLAEVFAFHAFSEGPAPGNLCPSRFRQITLTCLII